MPNARSFVHPKCGDGMMVGIEQCDDGNKTSGDGCNAGCKTEVGFNYPTPNMKCVASVCGDGNVDTAKAATTAEPASAAEGRHGVYRCFACTGGGACTPVAGTAAVQPANPSRLSALALAPPSTCSVETASRRAPKSAMMATSPMATAARAIASRSRRVGVARAAHPTELTADAGDLPDFRANGAPTGGHPHFENVNQDNKGIAGQPCTTANQATCGRLDNQGKPVTAGGFSSRRGRRRGLLRPCTLATWYRNTNTLGFDIAVVEDSLTLTQLGGVNSQTYEYASAAQFPLDGRKASAILAATRSAPVAATPEEPVSGITTASPRSYATFFNTRAAKH